MGTDTKPFENVSEATITIKVINSKLDIKLTGKEGAALSYGKIMMDNHPLYVAHLAQQAGEK